MTGRGAHGGSTRGQAWRCGSGTQTEGGNAHGEQGRAHDGSSARRPAPRWAPAGSSVHPRGPGRPGSELRAEGGSPRVSAFLLPTLGEGQEEATAHVGRSGKTWPLPPPPHPRPAARPKGRGQTRASGRRGQPAELRATSCGTAPAGGPEALLGKGPPGSQAPSPVPAPGSQRPPLSPVGLTHSPAAKTWGSRDRGGGPSHLGQVRSGDEPCGGRCSPAQQPGPEGGPKSPPLRPSLALKTVLLAGARKPRSCNHPAWGHRVNQPDQPESLGPEGLLTVSTVPRGTFGGSAPPPQLFLQEACLDACPKPQVQGG